MLLNISLTEIIAHQKGTYPIASLFLVVLIFLAGFALLQPVSNLFVAPSVSSQEVNPVPSIVVWEGLNTAGSNVKQLGIALYTMHTDLLIIASLLLLVAMIGAVALTLKRRAHAPQQDVFAQHNLNFQKIVVNTSTL
jgi:NADH-quinone oxidoreductase subunit J